VPTILFVEDDEAYRYAIGKLLEAAGFRVVPADDFTKALQVVEQEEVDLLLTDIRMPIGQPHGFALARMARQRRSALRVIYLTGLGDVPEPERDAALGKILYKPIEPEMLIAEIREVLGAAAGRAWRPSEQGGRDSSG
jgi:two-component system response regulator GlrR